jgi:uncharacterized membrane protein YkoI
MRELVSIGLLAVLLFSNPVVAAADNDRPPPAKITREAAIGAALNLIPGKRGKVEIERKSGRWVYVVEIITTKGDERDVFVDMETGEIIGTD